MPQPPIESRSFWMVRHGRARKAHDWVAVEEPLEIRVNARPLAVIMRTPGHDLELAAGFALTEGVVRAMSEIGTIRHCRGDRRTAAAGGDAGNAVDIALVPGVPFDRERLRRNLVASAACGLCGRASLETLAARTRPVAPGFRVERRVLASLPRRLLRAQEAFGRTGALHAAALFGAGGDLRLCREDVGRHNAVDKAIGHCLLAGAPVGDTILLVSGRTSFEILQKAAVAGIPVVCAISGPTTLAIEAAHAFNITLVNFLRGRRMNIAAAPARLTTR